MTLVAGGDSMIWGSELTDSLHGGLGGHSRKTFTALLSVGDYICAAYPGIGNKEISLRVIDAISLQPPTTSVIVCWTWSSRDNEINADHHIINLQEYLEYHKYPYLFTCVDNCIITNNPQIHWHNWYMFPPSTEHHQTIQPRGFYQWAVENKYKVGVDSHPLEGAHRAAAFLIKEKFDELVTKHN